MSALTKKIKRGFSLVEMTIVLGIVGVLIGGAWGVVEVGWETYDRQQATDEINTVVRSVRDAYASQAGMPTSGFRTLTSNAITQGLITRSMVYTTGCTNPGGLCAYAPWGSQIAGALSNGGTFRLCEWDLSVPLVACRNGATGGGVLMQTFAISLLGLPKGSCMYLAGHISGPNGPPGLIEVNINGTNLGPSGLGHVLRPIPSADMTAYCVAANGSNSVTFVYQLAAPPS